MDALPHVAHYGLVSSVDGCSALLVRREDPTQPWPSTDKVVGYYNPPGAVCLHDDHQGQGLGAEIILWTAVNLTHGAPTASLDEQCFTVAGWAAHQAAWRLGVKRGLIQDPECVPASAPVRRRTP